MKEKGLRIDKKIKELYPEVVKNDVQVHCAYDGMQEIWQVRLKKGNYAMKTILEKKDADLLMSGNRCLSLTVELQQLADSIKILEPH